MACGSKGEIPMKILALVLLLVTGHSFGNGWVENGKFRYDFGNDIVNKNIQHGKAMPRYQFNNPSQTVIQQPQYRYYHQPQYKQRQYDYRKNVKKNPNCWGPYC